MLKTDHKVLKEVNTDAVGEIKHLVKLVRTERCHGYLCGGAHDIPVGHIAGAYPEGHYSCYTNVAEYLKRNLNKKDIKRLCEDWKKLIRVQKLKEIKEKNNVFV